jgi:hypothetical protein
MKTFVPNQDAIIEQQLRDADRDRDLKWVTERLEKAEAKLSQLEDDWQNSGGYGSRSSITKCDNEVRLCRLALRGLKQSCHRCDLRWRNISTTVDTLEAEKEAGFDKIDIDRALSMIKSLY